MEQKRKTLLIGWDAADWKTIHPLLDKGQMPNLEKLINGGVMGNLATLDPPLSPMLWTSIATGKRPYKHGILGFTEPNPDGNGIRPIHVTGRKGKAIWNILTQEEYKTHVIGWWPSHPAEPINGVNISNFYQKSKSRIHEPWTMMKGTVHPAEMSDLFAGMRVHPEELTQAHLLPFVPKAAEVNQEKDKRLLSTAKIIAECSSIHAAATYILEHEEWDFLGVYYDGIDHFGHGFMKYNPPRRPHIPEKDYELYKNVVTAGYRFHDMLLGRLMKLAGEDTTIMLISDHGFYPNHLRPKAIPKEPAGPAWEHSPYGIICMSGQNIKKDERIYGATLLDIAPTILAMLDLPIGKDVDGKVLTSAFEVPPEIKQIDSWDDIEGEAGLHPENMEEDEALAKEALEQLIELGYVEKPDDDPAKAIKKTVDENQFYLARAYISGHQIHNAIEILTQLFEENPTQIRYGIHLAKCYQQTNQLKECREIVEAIKEQIIEDTPSLLLLEGTLLMTERKLRSAIKKFKEAEELEADFPKLHLQIGKHYVLLKQWKMAQNSFEKEIAIDKENAAAYHGLGITFLRQGEYEKAIGSLLDAVGLLYNMPLAHFHLGEAFYGIGEKERSTQAFEVSLTMAPGMNAARMWLIRIYKELGQFDKLKALEEAILPNTKGTVTIVSGLPRSGTSMMMQMLEKGGMEVFTDKVRTADDDNPQGYYEHELVKGLMRNKSWLKDVGEKAVKVVSHLLLHLPNNYHYKIVFMERDLDEVIRSQHRMLVNMGKAKEEQISVSLIAAFESNLNKISNWVKKQKNVEILYVPYKEVINNPLQQAEKVNNFLKEDLNTTMMSSVVDKSLYRQRIGA